MVQFYRKMRRSIRFWSQIAAIFKRKMWKSTFPKRFLIPATKLIWMLLWKEKLGTPCFQSFLISVTKLIWMLLSKNTVEFHISSELSHPCNQAHLNAAIIDDHLTTHLGHLMVGFSGLLHHFNLFLQFSQHIFHIIYTWQLGTHQALEQMIGLKWSRNIHDSFINYF